MRIQLPVKVDNIIKTLEAAGGLGAESHASDDENVFGHVGKPRRVNK